MVAGIWPRRVVAVVPVQQVKSRCHRYRLLTMKFKDSGLAAGAAG